jgi:hypothetical protein
MLHIKNIITPVIVIVFAVLFLDPFMVLMPLPMVYALLGAFFIAFVVYALLLWCERAADEREVAHRAFAARVAYLAGSATLVLGIIIEALWLGAVDPFLVVSLVVMTIAKFIGRSLASRCC